MLLNNNNNNNINNNKNDIFQLDELGRCEASPVPPMQSVLSMLVRLCYAMQSTVMHSNVC